jgi:hypothetical protein
MDPRDVTMPVRFFDWGRDATAIAAYMADWPAESRPLDPVTAEALAWTPAGMPLSEGLPGPGGSVPGREPAAGRGAMASVTPLFGGQQGGMPMYAAEVMVRQQLLAWYQAGKTTFTSQDLNDAKLAERAERSRTWPYQLMDAWCEQGLLELLNKNAKRSRRSLKTWETKLTAAERAQLGLEDTEEG